MALCELGTMLGTKVNDAATTVAVLCINVLQILRNNCCINSV